MFETDILGKLEYDKAAQLKLEGVPCTTFSSVVARILYQCIFSWVACLMQLGLGGMGLASLLRKKNVSFADKERKTLAPGESLGVLSFKMMKPQRQLR